MIRMDTYLISSASNSRDSIFKRPHSGENKLPCFILILLLGKITTFTKVIIKELLKLKVFHSHACM